MNLGIKIILIALVLYLFLIWFFNTQAPNTLSENTSISFLKRDDVTFFWENGKEKLEKLKKMHSIVVHCTSGLGNRLNTILAFYYVCRQYKIPLTIIWMKDGACNGEYNELFQDIDGVSVISERAEPVYYTGCVTIRNLLEYLGFSYRRSIEYELFSVIRLWPHIWLEVTNFVQKHSIQELVGIHVRRTDLTGNWLGILINGFNSDADFCKFIEKKSQEKSFFLATDNRETQQIYTQKYGLRAKYYKVVPYSSNLRKTSLKNAIIDLYILSFCRRIKGTRNSSFSDLARIIRRSRLFQNKV